MVISFIWLNELLGIFLSKYCSFLIYLLHGEAKDGQASIKKNGQA